MKAILKIFPSYCDAWLEYMNNFITAQGFVDYYDLNFEEFEIVAESRALMDKEDTWTALDYYVNALKFKNKIN